jgi:hypothetical protein
MARPDAAKVDDLKKRDGSILTVRRIGSREEL